jgi:glycosyltransferase involved in cell wall biosynthesis
MSNMVGRKRVLLLCQHFYPEMISTGMHMTELACALTRLGWQITVCCAQPSLLIESSNPHVSKEIHYQGIKIVRVSSLGSHEGSLVRRFLFALTYLMSSVAFAFRHYREFDGLLVTTNPPFLGLAGWLANLLLSKRYILIVYDVYPDIVVRLGRFAPSSFLVWVWERLTRLIVNGAFADVVIGRDMMEIISRKVTPANRHKLELIPNWSDDKIVYPVPRERNGFRQEHCAEDSFVVQYSGRMARTHNLEPLIEAAEFLRDRPVIFQFIGDGAKKQTLMKMAAEKHLKNVQFLPYQPLDRLGEVLSAADLAVVCLEHVFTGLSVPSKAYGIMASATPLLGFLEPESEIGRTISENDCGVVLPDATGVQVAKTIEELLNDPERLKLMGINGYEAFKANYTLTGSAEKYSKLLDALSYQ